MAPHGDPLYDSNTTGVRKPRPIVGTQVPSNGNRPDGLRTIGGASDGYEFRPVPVPRYAETCRRRNQGDTGCLERITQHAVPVSLRRLAGIASQQKVVRQVEGCFTDEFQGTIDVRRHEG